MSTLATTVGTGYINAGYGICLSVLFVYAISLILRRRRLVRAVATAERDEGAAAAPAGGPGPRGPSTVPAENDR